MGPQPLHPTQIYEGMLDLGLSVLLLRLVRRSRLQSGTPTLVYFAGYGSIRAFVSLFRADQPARTALGLSAPNVAVILAGAATLLLSVLILQRRLVIRRKSDPRGDVDLS